MFLDIVLVIVGLYMLILSFIFDVSNISSAIVFKLFPFLLGLICLTCGVVPLVGLDFFASLVGASL